MKKVLIVLSVVLAGIGVGCAALSEYVTPARIDVKAVQYATDACVADPNEFAGYANLEKAIRLEVAVSNAYEVKTLALQQMSEKNQLDYSMLKGVVAQNTTVARQKEAQLFGETGLLSVGLSMVGFGSLTGLLGLMRKRPGDITTAEMESALADVNGEVTNKDRQLIELIKGIQAFLDRNKTSDPSDLSYVKDLKDCLRSSESSDTKQTVAMVKATMT